MVARWEHGNDEHRQWLRDMCIPEIADALTTYTAAREAARTREIVAELHRIADRATARSGEAINGAADAIERKFGGSTDDQ